MSPRIKKLLALAIMLPGLVAYFFAAAALGERVPASEFLRVPYYVIAGLAWAVPARWLIIWANRESAPKRDNSA